MDFPTQRPPDPTVAAAARRVVFGFGVREIGVAILALGVLIASGLWYQRHTVQNDAALHDIQAELALRADAADVYRDSFAALENEGRQIQSSAENQSNEAIRTWARERSRRFEALVRAVDQQSDMRAFDRASDEIKRLAASGDIAGARAVLAQTPRPQFPASSEMTRLRHDLYLAPLADFSRQNPTFYRAFRQFEPEAAKQDEVALRSEITAATENVTPQLMLKVELLAAVAAPDDPVVADFSAMASAIDYFDNPDDATLARWRRAQHALRVQDYPTAVAEMQAIAISKVRTRQPFRAVLGRALIKSRPDQPAEAYPYLVEAARTGDKQARQWVAQQDYGQGRFAQAQQWLEAAAADGDAEGVPLLLELYQKHSNDGDAAREAGVLQRITDRPDAPAAAWLVLGRLYERDDPPGSTSAKAFACYVKAAAKGSAAGAAEVARCALRGIGTPVNSDLARDAACQAFSGGERENAAKVLLELMHQGPDRVAGAVQRMFDQESVNGGGAYMERKFVDGPGVSQLKALLAHYLDQTGRFGQAAKYYAGSRDPAAARRRAELTAGHPCQTCGGTGKVQESVACPTCGGKGKQICSYCGGTGFVYVPGSPPCPTCGGTGTMIQDRKVVACSACGGTGKGKGSVIKQACTHCDHGYIRCSECTNGVIVITKECPDCHGRGTWTMIDRGID